MATNDLFKVWTAKRKAEVILDTLKGMCALIEFVRKHDLMQSGVQSWG